MDELAERISKDILELFNKIDKSKYQNFNQLLVGLGDNGKIYVAELDTSDGFHNYLNEVQEF